MKDKYYINKKLPPSELRNQIYPWPKYNNELVFYSSPIKDYSIINQLFNLHRNLLSHNNNIHLYITNNKSNINIFIK